ncbi:type VI secretion system lipoprotein TssJ [Inquilinus sp. Marseille-Q2685]|uniref:type VI secretion system lipoprotein TssJ n=1 Tax=Inquilinus sp. Marseille-Q2685 TaxID=2866581 RepID=UPI001CE40770|nr:type VI secretion system lipoprotein TssJ [Inquilinus sp. Marseille-Q2685]
MQRLIALMGVAALLAGCGTAGAISDMVDRTLGFKPGDTTITVEAAANVNPDASGRPSPILVRIYQLKSGAALEQADYFKLTENPQAVLGDTLIGSEQMLLTPGNSRTLSVQLDPAARQIGVVAGFRDIDRARWRAVESIDPGDVDEVTIRVGASDISIKVED